jgi:putative sterol carrier protein
MAEFLSVAWIADLDAAARSLAPGDGPAERVIIEQQVRVPRGTASYQFHVSAAEIRVLAGAPAGADVVLATDLATAAALHRGELRAQDALAAGRLKVTGRPEVLGACAARLAQLDASLAAVRADTEFPAGV